MSDIVSDIRFVGGGKDYGLKLRGSGFEYGLQLSSISSQCFGLVADARESATSFFHIVKLCHYILILVIVYYLTKIYFFIEKKT